MRHRPDHKRRLLPCFQLHGLDGLVVTAIGGRGRGPPRHGAHADVVATAGKPLVQRWSSPLASRLEQGFTATLLVQSSPYLYSRDGAKTPLEGKCNNFCFL
jgi:hypothetical protein